MGLNTACWSPGKTYTLSPIQGLVVSTFLQPGGSTTLGNTISWAAENTLNVAVRIVLSFVLPNNGGPSTTTLTVFAGVVTPTVNWIIPAGSTNFQVLAQSLTGPQG